MPVQILQSNRKNFDCAQTIRRQQQQSQNHVCLELPIERSSAESLARPSRVGYGGAARPSGIVVRSPHWRDQPTTFLSSARNRRNARSELQLCATARFERWAASFCTN